MAAREVVLHALRLATIQRIWLLAAEIPDFSPRHGVTRQGLETALLRLDLANALALLGEIFPAAPSPSARYDYGEPPAPQGTGSYEREHARIFQPIGEMFEIVREIATAVAHEVGAFGEGKPGRMPSGQLPAFEIHQRLAGAGPAWRPRGGPGMCDTSMN